MFVPLGQGKSRLLPLGPCVLGIKGDHGQRKEEPRSRNGNETIAGGDESQQYCAGIGESKREG